ncbi:hypothetical protein F4801DRAFT_290414 [Xylaria longipes]|nr:hypothetical protein F4801DRAFT_290414 [Xylaria longipes]
MRPNGSRVPQRKPTSNTRSVDHDHNTDPACIDDQNASFFGTDLRIALFDGSLPAGQNFVALDVLSPAVTHPPMSTGFPNHNTHWSMAHQLPFVPQELDVLGAPRAFESDGPYMLDGTAKQFPNHLYNTAPTYDLSPSSAANGCAAHVVDNLGYQLTAASPASWASPLAPTYTTPPLTVVAWLENGNSPQYKCPKCPNTPKFGSRKDLDRHRITSKVHWSEQTRFYRCCCGAYDRPRKDHHLRHVQNCDALALISYRCICGRECSVRDEHVEHVKDCGRVRRRRQSTTP